LGSAKRGKFIDQATLSASKGPVPSSSLLQT
jgi:hypothetical protein